MVEPLKRVSGETLFSTVMTSISRTREAFLRDKALVLRQGLLASSALSSALPENAVLRSSGSMKARPAAGYWR